MPVIQYGNIAGLVKSFTEPQDELGNPKRYVLWAREQVLDGDEVDILYYNFITMGWESVVGVSNLEEAGDTDFSGLAANDIMQWNGTDWENRQNAVIGGTLDVTGITTLSDNLLIGNLTVTQGTDSINLAAASILTIKDNLAANIASFVNDTGDVTIDQGNLTVTAGTATAQSVNTSNAAGVSTFAGDIAIGDITIDESANALILAAASTLSVQNNAASNLFTVSEATGDTEVVAGDLTVTAGGFNVTSGISDFGGDITIGNLTIDESSNAILSTSNIILQGQTGSPGSSVILGMNVRIELEPGFQFVVFDDMDNEILTADNDTGDITIFQGNLEMSNNLISGVNGIEARSGAANPTNTDIPDGYVIPWENTTLGERRIWWNDGGTMYFSAAFTS